MHFLREHSVSIENPPPSNLGPLSEPWGREITQQVQANAEAIRRLGGDVSADGSVSNSALGNISYQINELRQRESGLVMVNDVNTANFSAGSVTNVVTINIPRPEVARIGWISVQFTAVNSNGNQTEVYGSFSVDGKIFHRDSRTVPTANLEPSSWNGEKAITGYTGFTAGPGYGGVITLTIQAENAYSSGSRFVTYKNIQATYQYGQAV